MEELVATSKQLMKVEVCYDPVRGISISLIQMFYILSLCIFVDVGSCWRSRVVDGERSFQEQEHIRTGSGN